MEVFTRFIEVDARNGVSSVWAVPDSYRHGVGSAVILAHGAANGMEHPFICHVHEALAKLGCLSVKFNFPYMEAGRKSQDALPLLEKTWKKVIEAVRGDAGLAPLKLFVGGKSMGGRVASGVVASGVAVDGLFLLGYPLHPPRAPAKHRVDHWPGIRCPVLFVQGTRDTLCDIELLKVRLGVFGERATLQLIEGGDHSFKRPKKQGLDEEAGWAEVVDILVGWLRSSGVLAG